MGKPLNLAKIIYDAYPQADLLAIDPDTDLESLQTLYERVDRDYIGDGLFTFIVNEVYEGAKRVELGGGDVITAQAAHDILSAALDDFHQVLDALAKAAVAEKPEVLP